MRKTYLVILGSALVVAGVAMLVLPGPGLVAIVAGLAVLASAGVLWAARLLVRTRARLPDPSTDDDHGMVGTAVERIDQHIAGLDAVERVREEDRRERERRHREQLVTSEQQYVEGEDAADELRTRRIADAGDVRPR